MLNNTNKYEEKRKDVKNSIPICPLMSAGSDYQPLCTQDNCAWYVKSYKMCAVYLMGHNAGLDIKAKQIRK